MEFNLKLLEEHAELTLQSALLGWKLDHYEALITELMSYLCEEDVLGKQYVMQYKKLKNMKMGSVD